MMEDNRRKIYPGYGRVFCYASTYAKISIDNYCRAKELYNSIVEANYDSLNLDEGIRCKFFDHVIVSVVFSAMAIEAFINDYAASCIGDDLYYQNFDHLSVIGKLQLISSFILKTEFDRTSSCYSYVKEIFSARDKFVHSKSQSAYAFFKKNNLSFFEESEECEYEFDPDDWRIMDKNELNEEFKLCKTAIKAMRNITSYFDGIDSNCYAYFRLLGFGSITEQEEDIKTVIADFSITDINNAK